MIQASGTQLVSLIEGLIDLSKLEASELVLYRQPLLFSTGAGARVCEGAERCGSQGPDVAGQRRRRGEPVRRPVRLEQMLSSYLGNAVKFTPLGGHIEVRLGSDATEFRCEVIDDGVGSALTTCPTFQPFPG
jgi:signal transduction histidine kinase